MPCFFSDRKRPQSVFLSMFLLVKIVINICVKILARLMLYGFYARKPQNEVCHFCRASELGEAKPARGSSGSAAVVEEEYNESSTPAAGEAARGPHLSHVGGRPKHLRTRKLVSEFGDQSGQQRLRLPLINFICFSAETRAAAQIPESLNMIGESALTRVPAAR